MTRRAARAAGVLITLSGLISLVVPAGWGARSGDAGGLYVFAVLRVVTGVLLIEAAAKSRMPRTLRVIGIAAVLAGLATPLLGNPPTIVVLDRWLAAALGVTRAWAALMLVTGVLILYAVGGERRRST